MVRKVLNGAYANTAFCIFDPQGKRRLSRSGRSPSQVIRQRGAEPDSNEGIIREMKRIASRYRARGNQDGPVLQDFLSFEQALNVASADQRLLVFVDAQEEAQKKVSPTLKKLFADKEIVGRFHLDFAGEEDDMWGHVVEGAETKAAINIIRSGQFGLEGEVVQQLPLETSAEDLKAALLANNKEFGATEKRKVYSNHVMEGKRKGIKYESEIPYGEDRDADGEIDQRSGGNRRGESGGRGGRRSRGR